MLFLLLLRLPLDILSIHELFDEFSEEDQYTREAVIADLAYTTYKHMLWMTLF